MNVDEAKTLCEKRILPMLASRLGFEPKFKLFIVPEAIFDTAISQKYPKENPDLYCGILAGKGKTMFVKKGHPFRLIAGFIHEVLHARYPPKDGESYLRYEMRIRFLTFSVFYGIMIYVLGKKAQEVFALISFRLDVPDYLKKNSHASLTRPKQSRREN